MTAIPRTMTLAGLSFLSGLASQKKKGVYLEVGPLFGSSTNAINEGRKDDKEPIHTIDTFEPAPWVRKRLGIDLGRDAFDKFTKHITNLHVHQGYAPDIVEDTWKEDIGFYFDDATHGDPGWTNNFDFFSKFFNDETIICGDDFASGWPDIVRNVYKYANDWDVKLYVIGRVWAMARKDEARIEKAIDKAFPKLKGVNISTNHIDGTKKTNKAACWSWGLHQQNPLKDFSIKASKPNIGKITTFRKGEVVQTSVFDGTKIDLKDIDQIYMSSTEKMKIQYCSLTGSNTANSKAMKSGQMFEIENGSKIVGLRLSD